MERQKAEQKAEQRDKVVVVQVIGLVEQFSVGKEHKEGDDADSIERTQCHRQRQNCNRHIDGIETKARQRFYPAKTIVGKVKVWLDVKHVNPAIAHKTQRAHKHQQTKDNAQQHQWQDRCLYTNGTPHSLQQGILPSRMHASTGQSIARRLHG